MAGEIVAPQIANGGAGSVQAGGVRAPDYREYQAPAQVNTNLPNNEAAARAAALSGAFKEFEGVSSDIYHQAASKAGALAGAASGATGHPQYREGLARFTTFGQAFNNAATGAYAIEAEADADDSAARLRVQANNDPAAFQASFSAHRDAVLKNAPALAVPMLTELYNRYLAEGMAAISGDQATEQRTRQAGVWSEGVDRQTSRVATLQGSANPDDQVRAQDEQVKLTQLIDGGVTNGLYSKAAAEAMHINAARSITKQVFTTQIDRTLSEPDPAQSNADLVKVMENFRQMHLDNLNNPKEPTVFSENEFQSLMQTATTRVREQRILDMMTKAQGKSAEQLRFEAGDQQYTDLFLRHQLTDSQLAAAVRTQDLKPETARALHSQLANGPVLKSDPNQRTALTSDPRFLDMSRDEILAWPGISNPDKIRIFDEQQKRRDSWEGTQPVKDAEFTITTALKVPQGSLLVSDDQKKAAGNALQDFKTRMSTVDPAQHDRLAASVAQDVIKAEHQREAANSAKELSGYRANTLRDHGPGSAQPWDDKRLQERLKQYDSQIATLNAQAKGQ